MEWKYHFGEIFITGCTRSSSAASDDNFIKMTFPSQFYVNYICLFYQFYTFCVVSFCEDPWPLSCRQTCDTAIMVADALALSGTVDSHSNNNMVLYNIVLHTAQTYNTNMYSENK